MEVDAPRLAETGAAALLFAAVFVFGGRIHPLRAVVRDRRSIVSFCAGMSMAYVFVRLMPELHGAREAFAQAATIELRHGGMAIYLVARIGFLAFHGLHYLRARRERSGRQGDEARAFKVRMAGFAAYVGLMSYLLVRGLEESTTATALYALAFACHFLALDHSLREEHSHAYQTRGRWWLAGMCLLGWAVGTLLPLPVHVLALLVAFVSGAVIVNNAVMELPSDKDGRFVPFMAGGLLYALLLLPLS